MGDAWTSRSQVAKLKAKAHSRSSRKSREPCKRDLDRNGRICHQMREICFAASEVGVSEIVASAAVCGPTAAPAEATSRATRGGASHPSACGKDVRREERPSRAGNALGPEELPSRKCRASSRKRYRAGNSRTPSQPAGTARSCFKISDSSTSLGRSKVGS